MGKSVDNVSVIKMMSTGMTLAIPQDDTDYRAFLVCEECWETFLLMDNNEQHPAQVLSRVLIVLNHVTRCPGEIPPGITDIIKGL